MAADTLHSRSKGKGRATVPVFNADWASSLLQRAEEIGRTPLSALLFLLDAASFLRDLSDRSLGHHDSSQTHQSNERLERWSEWLLFAREVYFLENLPDCQPADWQCPLSLPKSILEPISAVLPSPQPADVAQWHASLLESCQAALLVLQKSQASLSGASSARIDAALIKQQLETVLMESADAPLPLDWDLLRRITHSLQDCRRRASGTGAERYQTTHIYRWILASILEQHYGTLRFGQKRDISGRIIYATESQDDAALRDFFPPLSGSGSVADAEEVLSPVPTSSEADAISKSPLVHKASQIIQQRDAVMHAALSRSLSRTSHHRPSSSEPSITSPATEEALFSHRRTSSSWLSGSQSSLRTSFTQDLPRLSQSSSQVPLIAEATREREADHWGRDIPMPTHRPFSDFDTPPVHSSDGMPLTSNALSLVQRRDLVKRSRKLQSMLGATLDEEAAQYTLVGGLRPAQHQADAPPSPVPSSSSFGSLKRSSSFPPPSPVQTRRASAATLRVARIAAPADGPSSPETPYWRFDSDDENLTTDATSPELGPVTPHDFGGQRARTSKKSSSQAKEWEDRRRRIAKLQRLLGERVPVELLSSPDQSFSERPSLSKPSSSRLGSAFSRLSLRSISMGRSSTEASSGRNSEDLDAEVLANGISHTALPPKPVLSRRLTPEETIASIRKARKLERLFGQLPPAALYEPRATGSFFNIESDDDEASFAADTRLRRGSATTAATLLRIHDTDPTSIDDLMQRLADEESYTEDASSPELPARPSVDVRRHYRRASKLSRIFGTTHAEVLKNVLEDLEADLDEDSEVDQEERAELRAGLQRLRGEVVW